MLDRNVGLQKPPENLPSLGFAVVGSWRQRVEKFIQLFKRLAKPACAPGGDGAIESFL
jgi:hypothetical protein